MKAVVELGSGPNLSWAKTRERQTTVPTEEILAKINVDQF